MGGGVEPESELELHGGADIPGGIEEAACVVDMHNSDSQGPGRRQRGLGHSRATRFGSKGKRRRCRYHHRTGSNRDDYLLPEAAGVTRSNSPFLSSVMTSKAPSRA